MLDKLANSEDIEESLLGLIININIINSRKVWIYIKEELELIVSEGSSTITYKDIQDIEESLNNDDVTPFLIMLDKLLSSEDVEESLLGFSIFLDICYRWEYAKEILDLIIISKGSSTITYEEIQDIEESLNNYDTTLFFNMLEKLLNSEEVEEYFLGKYIIQNEEYKFQVARYDGDLQGTEVGMVLFYTDLLAKIWAIDYEYSAPDQDILGFVNHTKVSLSPIYKNEAEELNSVRLWFGHEDLGFQVTNDSILFARNATKIYAASSNSLEPGAEVPASAHFSEAIYWWNDHYEEVAQYEKEYERLNEIMKWSLIISWLNS